MIGSRHGEGPRQRRLPIGDGKRELFHSIAHDMRLDHEHERRIDVSQLELGESGRLQVFPGFPGDQATVPKVIPGRLENVLEEVGPCGGVGNHMLHEEEGSTLQSKDEIVLLKCQTLCLFQHVSRNDEPSFIVCIKSKVTGQR